MVHIETCTGDSIEKNGEPSGTSNGNDVGTRVR